MTASSSRLLVATIVLACATSALAQSRAYTTPNITTQAGAQSVSLGGQAFVNQGLMGAGRLSANTLDFRNETLGSFSGMSINLNTWRRNADGSYGGGIFTLPDRGPFDGGIDYRDRVHTSNITFRPLAAGSAALPQATTSQSQVTITPTGGFTLKDANGVEFTGRDPGASTVTRNGVVYPLATDGTAAGHIALDPEAIAFLPDGTFYISDEYAAGIYRFDATGRQIGVIQTVNALLPRNAAGTIDFNSVTPGVVGRRNNQGLEAMALTPDNKKLVTILQSATVQDTNGANQQTRNNTRILIYDLNGGATPAAPIGHYVLQLPIFNNNGSGGAPDRTAAQSEVLALNDTQFLVLARDGLGRGTAANASTSTTPLYKSILLVDIAGATNLAGTQYETGTAPIAGNGTLIPAIVPVQQVELVNLLNPTQLARVGMNITRLPVSTPTTISEKLEALALAPVLEEGAPQDFFLFVGNDNDFQATNASFNGAPATLGALDGTGNNDSVFLVYRLTLPSYVDPVALATMIDGAPVVLTVARSVAADLGTVVSRPVMERLGSLRRLGEGDGLGHGLQLWLNTDWHRIDATNGAGTNLARADGLAIAGGVDYGIGSVRAGVAIGYEKVDDGAPVRIDASATSVAAYAGFALPAGLYGQAAAAKTVRFDIDRLTRPSAYGQTARGKTGGEAWTATGEIGWLFGLGAARVGPFGAVEYVDAELDAFTETGASVSNVAFQDLDYRLLRATAGGEARIRISDAVIPSLRVGYAWDDERGDRDATVRLAAAQHSLGTQTVALPVTERDHVVAGFDVQGAAGPLSYRFGATGRFARGRNDARVSLGVSLAL